jgi:hypothetical protein
MSKNRTRGAIIEGSLNANGVQFRLRKRFINSEIWFGTLSPQVAPVGVAGVSRSFRNAKYSSH